MTKQIDFYWRITCHDRVLFFDSKFIKNVYYVW